MIALLELVDAFDACALKAHDSLVVIAHRHDVGVLDALTQQVDCAHLRAVGVLELVDLDVAIGILEALAQLVTVLDGADEIEDHVVVVVQASRIELSLIARRNLAGNLELPARAFRKEHPAGFVAPTEKRLADGLVACGFPALFIHQLRSAHRIAKVHDERDVSTWRNNDGTHEFLRGNCARALDFGLEILGKRGSCPPCSKFAMRGMLLQPHGGVDSLVSDSLELAIRKAAALDP